MEKTRFYRVHYRVRLYPTAQAAVAESRLTGMLGWQDQ